MSDEKDPISEIVEAVQDVREFVNHPNVRTAVAYSQNTYLFTKVSTIAAAALVSGALATGGPALSAEQPVRKPHEHVGVQTQENTVAYDRETLAVGSTSGDRMWSHDDSTPLWSGNDFAPMWQTRANTVRATRIG